MNIAIIDPNTFQKVCSSCDAPKLLSDFPDKNSGKLGRSAKCRECTKQAKHNFYLAHKSQIRTKRNQYISSNSERINQSKRDKWANDPDYRAKQSSNHKRWRTENREAYLNGARRWYAENRDKAKSSKLKRAYGITQDEYDLMFLKQNGLCAICAKPDSVLHVDHDHTTKKVRGLLCQSCNLGLGCLGDNLLSLQSAVDYLMTHETKLTTQ